MRRRCQSLSVLDSILMPVWDYRFFSYNSKWGDNEEMASMRNGAGSEYYIVFNKDGAIGKVFKQGIRVHNISNLQNCIPESFSFFIREEAFNNADVSFYFWSFIVNPNEWMSTSICENDMLDFLIYDSDTYHKWAENYYERDISIDSINSIYNHEDRKSVV